MDYQELDNTTATSDPINVFNYWMGWMKLNLFNFKLIRNQEIKDKFLRYLENEQEYELCQILVEKEI